MRERKHGEKNLDSDRKEFEEKLRISEKRLNNILCKLPEGVAIADINETLTQVNDAFAAMLGYTPEELHGRSILDLIPPYEVEKIGTGTSLRQEGRASAYELEMIHKTGAVKIVRVSAVPLTDDEEEHSGTVAVIVDITEEKQAKDALRKSEERYRSLVDNAPNVILNVDREGKIDFISPSSREYDVEGYVDTSVFDHTDPDYHEKIRKALNDVFTNGQTVSVILEGKNTDRTSSTPSWYRNDIAPIRLDDEVVAATIIATDITEQVRIETELRQLSKAVEQSPSCIVVTNVLGDIEYVNPKFTEITGYSSDETIGVNPRILKSELTPPETYEDLWSKVTSGKEWRGIFINKKKDGEHYWEDAIISPILDPDGRITHYIGVKEDITEKRKADEHLKKQKEELSVFAHEMAHDLKNPLMAISGYAQLLEDGYDKNIIARLKETTKRVFQVLDRSLALADAGQIIGELVEVDLNELVANVASSFLPPEVNFVQGNLPKVMCDREKVLRIIQNLLTNAVEHGGPTAIEVTSEEYDEGIRICVNNDGDTIPAEHCDKIFRRGFSSEEDRGLGLFIVKRLVEAHGWTIQLEPEPITSFQILIPQQP